MKIRVDLFKKQSGKWKYGGEVEIGDLYLWQDNFISEILRNQRIVIKGTITSGEYFMLTNNLPDDTHNSFCQRLFFPETLKSFEYLDK